MEPAKYQDGLNPAGGLSAVDRTWVKGFYPELKAAMPKLEPYQSKPLSLDPGEQADFRIEPAASAIISSRPSARRTPSWFYSKTSMASCAMWQETTTAARNATQTSPPNSSKAANTSCAFGSIGREGRDRPPSCTGSPSRRELRPGSLPVPNIHPWGNETPSCAPATMRDIHRAPRVHWSDPHSPEEGESGRESQRHSLGGSPYGKLPPFTS